jgi:hypothetical protein
MLRKRKRPMMFVLMKVGPGSLLGATEISEGAVSGFTAQVSQSSGLFSAYIIDKEKFLSAAVQYPKFIQMLKGACGRLNAQIDKVGEKQIVVKEQMNGVRERKSFRKVKNETKMG